MLGGEVAVAAFALVILVWNLGRVNDVMKVVRFFVRFIDTHV